MTEIDIAARIQRQWMDLCIYVKGIHTLIYIYISTRTCVLPQKPKTTADSLQKYWPRVFCFLADAFSNSGWKPFSKKVSFSVFRISSLIDENCWFNHRIYLLYGQQNVWLFRQNICLTQPKNLFQSTKICLI